LCGADVSRLCCEVSYYVYQGLGSVFSSSFGLERGEQLFCQRNSGEGLFYLIGIFED